eukprot:1156248-Pelagomonas_calceolata.AAC.11
MSLARWLVVCSLLHSLAAACVLSSSSGCYWHVPVLYNFSLGCVLLASLSFLRGSCRHHECTLLPTSLLPTCFCSSSPTPLLQAAAGTTLHFTTTASGAVHWNEAHASEVEAASDSKAADKPSKGGSLEMNPPQNGSLTGVGVGLKISIPKWPGKWVVGMDEYKDGVVGAKSKNIAGLRGKMPDWISLPASVTLPFGSYEQMPDLKPCQHHGCCPWVPMSRCGFYEQVGRCKCRCEASLGQCTPAQDFMSKWVLLGSCLLACPQLPVL